MPKETAPETIDTIRTIAAQIEASLLDLTLAIDGGEIRLAHRHYTAACQQFHQLGLSLVLQVTHGKAPAQPAIQTPQS